MVARLETMNADHLSVDVHLFYSSGSPGRPDNTANRGELLQCIDIGVDLKRQEALQSPALSCKPCRIGREILRLRMPEGNPRRAGDPGRATELSSADPHPPTRLDSLTRPDLTHLDTRPKDRCKVFYEPAKIHPAVRSTV